jgi:signal transduction histidine kinase
MILRGGFILVTFLLSCVAMPCSGQDSDTLLTWYQSFFHDVPTLDPNQRIASAVEKLEEAKSSGNLARVARAMKEVGLIKLTLVRDLDEAMDHFLQALTIEDSLGLRERQTFTYIAIADAFEYVGNHQRSAEYLQKALNLNAETGSVPVFAFILNKLGKVNAALGNIDQAFANYELVIANRERLNRPSLEAQALFNIAILHASQGNYQDALRDHWKALSIWRSLEDKRNEAISLSSIGELYHLMKNDARALANHVAALKIRRGLGDKRELAESYNNIGIIYYARENFERAIANLELALAAGLESEAKQEISRSYEYLSNAHRKQGDYKRALEYKELHHAILDFIQTEKNERELLEIQNRYEMAQKESQIVKLEYDSQERERELRTQKSIRNFLYALVALILIIVVLILYSYIQKQKHNRRLQVAHNRVQHKNAQLQKLNATKDKFFSIISHDLRGPLNSLTSFSELLINHMDQLTRSEIQSLARDLDLSVKNLYGLLENLLEWSRSQTGTMHFMPEPFDLSALLEENRSLLSQQAQNKRITLLSEAPEGVIVRAHKHSVSTVIRNLISNAIKFTPQGGAIKLKIKCQSGEAIVSVADTGVGMDQEAIEKIFRIDAKHTTMGTANEKGTGLGLILCKEFVEKNHGKIWVTSEPGKGSTFYFSLPVHIAREKPAHEQLTASPARP